MYKNLLLLALAMIGGVEARTLDQIKQSGTLKIITNAEYEPFEYLKDGQPVDFEIELGNEIARRLGVKAEWTNRPFAVLLDEVNANQVSADMALSSHAITSTRLKQVNFSNGIYCTGSVILTRAGGPLTAKDLTGRLVAAEVGSINLGFLKKLPNSPSIKVMASSADALDALVNRKVDAVIDGNIAALQAVKSSTDIKLQVSPLLWKTQAGIAFAKSKDSDELRRAVNKVYADMLNDGTFKRLSEKYFGQDIRC